MIIYPDSLRAYGVSSIYPVSGLRCQFYLSCDGVLCSWAYGVSSIYLVGLRCQFNLSCDGVLCSGIFHREVNRRQFHPPDFDSHGPSRAARG
jgi:hypothetical protein